MSSLFMNIVDLSITASYAIIFITTARFLLKKAPKKFSYFLWFIVLFKLIIPITFESNLSIMPITDIDVYSLEDFVSAPTRPIDIDETVVPLDQASIPFTQITAVLWFLTTSAILLYSFTSFNKFRKKLINSHNIKENIYTSDIIKTPFVLGILKPKIYIPTPLKPYEEDYIIEHEKTHIKRYDHIVQLVFFIITCIHWFNPLIWISYNLMTKDMEMSCDEGIISKFGKDIKKDYSTSLLALATPEQSTINKLAFGSNDTKNRIKNVLSYKNPKTLIVTLSLIGISLISVSIISSKTTPLDISLSSDSNPRIIEPIDNDNPSDSNSLCASYEYYEILPDYSYTRDDVAKRIAIESALQRFRKISRGQFNIADAHIYGVYQEKDKIKIFTDILIQGFVLSENIIYPQNGQSVLTAITCTKNKDGSYTVDKYEEANDDAFYGPSIEKFCTMPISKKKIVNLSKEILTRPPFPQESFTFETLLKEHLIKHNKTGVSYLYSEYPKNTYIDLT
ncbi:MAG: M56 family metallopeptidase [Sarcina sp.]